MFSVLNIMVNFCWCISVKKNGGMYDFHSIFYVIFSALEFGAEKRWKIGIITFPQFLGDELLLSKLTRSCCKGNFILISPISRKAKRNGNPIIIREKRTL